MELPADVRALFEAPNYAHLATVLPGDGPHTVPLWAGIEDRQGRLPHLARFTEGTQPRRRPAVAISVTDRGNPYVMALVRGRVTARLDGNPAWEIIDRLSRKYTGAPYPLRTDRVVFLVEADHAHAHALRVTATPPVSTTGPSEHQ